METGVRGEGETGVQEGPEERLDSMKQWRAGYLLSDAVRYAVIDKHDS